jgi:hypothetical protein
VTRTEFNLSDMNDMNIIRFIYKEETLSVVKRKLIKQGAGGLTIYLPKRWVEQRGLNHGEEVTLEDLGTSLLVSGIRKERMEIELTLSAESTRDLRNILTHLYRNGYDLITLRNANAKAASLLTKELLLGFEVTSTADYVRIENVSEPAEERYDVLLRRIFFIIKETQRIIREDAVYAQADEIEELRKQQDRLILYCRRVLIKEVHQRNPVLGWELLTFLMHIEHAYYYLYQYMAQHKVKSKIVKELLHDLEEYFDLYYDAFFKRDITYIHELNRRAKELQFGKCYTALEKAKGSEVVALSHIRELLRLVQIGSSPILSMLTNV